MMPRKLPLWLECSVEGGLHKYSALSTDLLSQEKNSDYQRYEVSADLWAITQKWMKNHVDLG